ncbi:MAG TPA: ribosomal protein S18-alanine N-acetyltransferase [Candidatus Acidoferrales bacterium]|nr:ribosomal protein S18-alanine N-acetyltransferase [Candidatus Acidoferrales bacterium]
MNIPASKVPAALAITIREMQSSDADSVLTIQTQSIEAAQWPKKDYESLERAGFRGWVALVEDQVAGFLVVRLIAGEVEILNLAVAPNMRRRGFGESLLNAAITWAGQNGASRAYLEVRQKNHSAAEFYKAHGFHAIGMRPNYYFNPPDDAILLAAWVSRS